MPSPVELLPRTHLIAALTRRSKERDDITFPFLESVASLRQVVAAESRFVLALFPEFTPHDDEFHLSRLFHVADTLLGEPLISRLNSVELLILSLSLYAHDWGMAVSEAERMYITEGRLLPNIQLSDLSIFPGELKRFAAFREMVAANPSDPVSLPLWRQYVRETHAQRSALRAKNYFIKLDAGLGDAVARVCLGHWLPAEDLRDRRTYPTELSVLRESVNLCAIAVYLRLIDLFDIGDDRTPYVWWKFVAPQDRASSLEWNKHRAIRPVTCPPYMDGRVIRVDGSTDDNNVYAGLEDLRAYAEGQFKESQDTLSERRDDRHKLDLFRVDWQVVALGFDPTVVRFEFDRTSVLQILTDEIYKGDAYVFLRELLQNSVDAIRMRSEVLHSAGAAYGVPIAISVESLSLSDGTTAITWHDDGIGMDDFIVTNYLAIAGRSYYKSDQFQRQHLKMDPISRFGVGILSCFMVADRLEIQTFREPYLSPEARPLNVIIPDVERQFRVSAAGRRAVGTTITVVIDEAKLRLRGVPGGLDIEEYLRIVAAFVEVPIVIQNGDRHTVIVSPLLDKTRIGPLVTDLSVVQSLSLRFPLEEAFVPQDVANAKRLLTELSLDVVKDLGLEGYEGSIALVLPKDTVALAKNDHSGIQILEKGEKSYTVMRWAPEWGEELGLFRNAASKKLSRSAKRTGRFGVYRDGLLLPEVRLPSRDASISNVAINLNIRKVPGDQIDLARTEVSSVTHWFEPVQDALNLYFCRFIRSKCLNDSPRNNYFRANQAALFAPVSEKTIAKELGLSWPVVFLNNGGKLDAEEWGKVASDDVTIIGSEFVEALKELVIAEVGGSEEYTGAFRHWNSGKVLISPASTFSGGFMQAASEIQSVLLNQVHYRASVDFARLGGGSIIVKELWMRRTPEIARSYLEVLDLILNRPRDLTSLDTEGLTNRSSSIFFVGFPAGAEPLLAYRVSTQVFVNVTHPLAHLLLAAVLLLRKVREDGKVSEAFMGTMEDEIGSFESGLQYGLRGGEKERLASAAQQLGYPGSRIETALNAAARIFDTQSKIDISFINMT
jgi:hypothetical protein